MTQDELSGAADEGNVNDGEAIDDSAAMDRRRFVERSVAAGAAAFLTPSNT